MEAVVAAAVVAGGAVIVVGNSDAVDVSDNWMNHVAEIVALEQEGAAEEVHRVATVVVVAVGGAYYSRAGYTD